jgi:ubiquinone/menaquinone biosynthesis C-methylase UbiE
MLQLQLAAMYPELSLSAKVPGSAGLPRAESMSSVSAHTTASNRTMPSTEQHQSEAPAYHHRPFIVRNGRTYFSDPTIAYPLPVDLEEIHRQTLKTMLLMQLHGRPICSPRFANKPPSRILEVGCGSGFWSMMCYRYYEARGQHANMSFTGMDIVPFPPTSGGPKVPPSSAASAEADTRPDKDMNWHYVHHDIRKQPFPFPDSSFDFVMVKDMGLASPLNIQQGLIDEYIRILEPGGTVEIWETDHTIRMLRPHVPDSASTVIPAPTPIPTFNAEDHRSSDHNNTNNNNSSNNNSETDQQQQHPNNKPGGGCPATEVGAAYLMTPGTPLSTPTNMYLVEYNGWVAKALEQRLLFAMPCTAMESVLVQEAELLKEVGSRRLAVPLSEVRWEREGVGGVVTKDGKSYIETGKAKQRLASGASSTNSGSSGSGAGGGGGGGPSLDPAAAALRHTALMTVVGEIQSLDHILREVSGKSQDEWDAWMGKMMNDLVRENGTSWGECLEVGAWWARKR